MTISSALIDGVNNSFYAKSVDQAGNESSCSTSALNYAYSSENTNGACKWDNKEEIPCLEIKGQISNSSMFSKSGINKIVITKKQIPPPKYQQNLYKIE